MPPTTDRTPDARVGFMTARQPWLALALLGLILGFTFQGARGLWSPDEGRYTDGAVQMLDSGNLLAPAYSPARPNFSKPPMTYWLIAASLKVFGRNTWAARAPYALAFAATLLLLLAMGRHLLPERPWLPSLIYALAPMPLFAANLISTDMFLALFETLAMLGFVRAAFSGSSAPDRRGYMLMWLGFALAFLTKGPPGLIPLLAIIPFIQQRDGWRGVGRLFPPGGMAIFLVVGGLWYVLAILRYPWLLHYFLHREVYDRMFTAVQRRHPGLFGWVVAYVPTLILGTLPWWPMLLAGKARERVAATWHDMRDHRNSPARFLMLWLLLPLLVFCLVQSRLPLYILPLMVPACLLLALMLRDRIDLGRARVRLGLALWLLTMLVIKGGAGWWAHVPADDRASADQISALARGHDYASIGFIENTSQDYAIEEKTPWGLHLYMDKPVFGVAWQKPKANARLCRLVHQQGPMLLVFYPGMETAQLNSALTECAARGTRSLGTWRHRALVLVGS